MTDTDLHVPSHIQMTIRIAEQETKSATAWTVREAELRGQFDEHQRDAAAERERIEAELQAARADAERRLNALAEVERKLTAELAEAGRCKEHHGREALDAQQSVADWCTRHGIRPDELPVPDGTGPLPVVPAPAEPVVQVVADGPPMAAWVAGNVGSGSWVCRVCREPVGPDGCGAHTHLSGDPLGERPVGALPIESSQPLPVIPDPADLLAIGKRMADPAATRTDLPGGDGPDGPFQGDTDA